jgi:hypothetical protein
MVTRDIATSENENILPSSYRRDIMTYRLPIDSLSEQDDFFEREGQISYCDIQNERT